MTTIITFTFHDGEILSRNIYEIALSDRKDIVRYCRGNSEKKRLIKGKMDIEKKKSKYKKKRQRNSTNSLRLVVTRS